MIILGAFPKAGQGHQGEVGEGYTSEKRQSGTIVRTPDNITPDTPVCVYFTGQIGSADSNYLDGSFTTSHYINEFYSENPDFDGVLIVAYGAETSVNARVEEVSSIIGDLETENNVTFNNVSGTGSSSGDQYATKFIAHEAMEGRTGLTLGITGGGCFNRHVEGEVPLLPGDALHH